MGLRCKCPQCGQEMQVAADLAGQRVRCPSCQAVLKLPGQDRPAPGLPNRNPSSRPQPARRAEQRDDAQDAMFGSLPAATTAPLPDGAPEILFQSAYGAMPKFALYGAFPFLLFASVAVFVRAVWYNGGVEIRGFELSPTAVIYGVCPLLWLLCGLMPFAEIYHRLHPNRVVLTTAGLTLPKGRFTSREIHIRWTDLQASRKVYDGFYDMYEVRCADRRHGTKATIYSVMFRRFDDFATFALIVGERIGQDWSIKGFLPGTFRGRRNQRP